MTDPERGIVGTLEDVLENAKLLKIFAADLKTQYAVIRTLEIVGEATKRLPLAFRDAHPDIPWRKMAGMRDVLAHQYEGVNPLVLYRTATKDIDIVIDRLPALIAEA